MVEDIPTPYHHPYPKDTSLDAVLRALPAGQAVSVGRVYPFWDVCARLKPGTTTVREYFVTEIPVGGGKPKRVTTPYKTEEEAKTEANLMRLLWHSTHGGLDFSS